MEDSIAHKLNLNTYCMFKQFESLLQNAELAALRCDGQRGV